MKLLASNYLSKGMKLMTRKRMYDAIKSRLAEEGLEITDESKAVVDAAISCALDYVLAFAQEVSHELTSQGLYSEAMVAGVFIRKVKGLISGNY